MSTAPTAPAQANTPAPETPQPRRRDLLVGALGGVFGLTGGLAAGGVINKKPRTWAGDKVIPTGAKVSYAQFADDLVAAHLFNAINVEKPTYLDIGAFDPINDNNTYLFYLAGSRGVLVEPNKAITERLRSVRPLDTLLVAAIGIGDEKEADYYMFDNPGLNTIDKDDAMRVERDTPHKLQQVVKVPLLNINNVIAEHFGGKAPDYISIDIEGLDYDVLKSLNYKKYRPKIICAETIILSTLKHNPKTVELLTANNYEVRGMTVANTFFVDKALLPA
jgi:FkbM family methyltransferase